jgi:hypothetical protein
MAEASGGVRHLAWSLAHSLGGEYMENRYRSLLPVAIISLWAIGGPSEHALALTFTEFPLPSPS